MRWGEPETIQFIRISIAFGGSCPLAKSVVGKGRPEWWRARSGGQEDRQSHSVWIAGNGGVGGSAITIGGGGKTEHQPTVCYLFLALLFFLHHFIPNWDIIHSGPACWPAHFLCHKFTMTATTCSVAVVGMLSQQQQHKDFGEGQFRWPLPISLYYCKYQNPDLWAMQIVVALRGQVQNYSDMEGSWVVSGLHKNIRDTETWWLLLSLCSLLDIPWPDRNRLSRDLCFLADFFLAL